MKEEESGKKVRPGLADRTVEHIVSLLCRAGTDQYSWMTDGGQEREWSGVTRTGKEEECGVYLF